MLWAPLMKERRRRAEWGRGRVCRGNLRYTCTWSRRQRFDTWRRSDMDSTRTDPCTGTWSGLSDPEWKWNECCQSGLLKKPIPYSNGPERVHSNMAYHHTYHERKAGNAFQESDRPICSHNISIMLSFIFNFSSLTIKWNSYQKSLHGGLEVILRCHQTLLNDKFILNRHVLIFSTDMLPLSISV